MTLGGFCFTIEENLASSNLESQPARRVGRADTSLCFVIGHKAHSMIQIRFNTSILNQVDEVSNLLCTSLNPKTHVFSPSLTQ